MALRSRNKVEVSYSVAGMTDIIFLLLLFFMLTSTLISPNAVKLLLPAVVDPNKPQQYHNKGHRIYIERTQIDFSQLEPTLRQKIGKTEEPTIAIHADRSVPIEFIVEVMNIAKRNNYKVILATSPETK
jgi:biopolymer transport protein ExbD